MSLSDVFTEVHGRFDLIVFDPPFRWFAPRSRLESPVTDEGYWALTRFFDQLHLHLAPGGRVLLFFGTSGDLDHVRRLIETHRLEAAEVVRRTHRRGESSVDYVTWLLTSRPEAPQV